MYEDPFKNKQEKLDIKVRLATQDDWQICKDLRLQSIVGSSADMFGITPEIAEQEVSKSVEEWRQETQSEEMFSVLALVDYEAVGLGRTKQIEKGIWRIRNGYVVPKFEGRGIQTKMIALRLDEIIKRGGVKAVTGIRMNNPISLHNAKKFGFFVKSIDEGWGMMELDLTKLEVIEKINTVLNAG